MYVYIHVVQRSLYVKQLVASSEVASCLVSVSCNLLKSMYDTIKRRCDPQVDIHVSGFHLDIDSRDGKILILWNKGWRGYNPCYRARQGPLLINSIYCLTIQGIANELPGMAGTISHHPLNETLCVYVYMQKVLKGGRGGVYSSLPSPHSTSVPGLRFIQCLCS